MNKQICYHKFNWQLGKKKYVHIYIYIFTVITINIVDIKYIAVVNCFKNLNYVASNRFYSIRGLINSHCNPIVDLQKLVGKWKTPQNNLRKESTFMFSSDVYQVYRFIWSNTQIRKWQPLHVSLGMPTFPRWSIWMGWRYRTKFEDEKGDIFYPWKLAGWGRGKHSPPRPLSTIYVWNFDSLGII